MKKETFLIEQKQCIIYHGEKPQYILLQPVNDHEMENLDRQVSLIQAEVSEPFIFVAFLVEKWNQELSPWNAPPVLGADGFGDGAGETLRFIREKILPFVTEQYACGSNIPVIMGGYSLAGLFALWSACQTETFSAVAAVSPSVWFPGWSAYTQEHKFRTDRIYLSLGRKEETRSWQRWETASGSNISGLLGMESNLFWSGMKETIFRNRICGVQKVLYGVSEI